MQTTTNALVLLLLLTASAAVAQTAPTASNAPSTEPTPRPQFTSADTVRALHRLFRSRQTSGALLLGLTGMAAVASNVAITNDASLPMSGADGFIVATGIAALYTAPFWVVGTSQLVRFSKKKQQLIIDEFIKTRTLPQKIKRRLTPRLFT